MAIYHCEVKPVSRAQGRSSTAGAAYRSCSKVYDERTAELHDYTRKHGLEHAEIVLSREAAEKDIQWARDRQQLWNAAEAAEARKDARVAREYEVALPHELSKAQRIELARAFASDIANRYQCAVDFAIHKPHRSGDARNFHAHLLATTRQVTPQGLGEKTYIEWSDGDRKRAGLQPGKGEILTIRERWAGLTNRALEAAHRLERIDHRSLKDQGMDRAPTHHKGPAVAAIEARGERSIVAERMRAEEVAARLEKAAELGRASREAAGAGKRGIELSTDVSAARRARDVQPAPSEAPTPTQKQANPKTREYDPEEGRRRAREAWLKNREGRGRQEELDRDRARAKVVERGKAPEHPPARDRGRGRDGPDDGLSQ